MLLLPLLVPVLLYLWGLLLLLLLLPLLLEQANQPSIVPHFSCSFLPSSHNLSISMYKDQSIPHMLFGIFASVMQSMHAFHARNFFSAYSSASLAQNFRKYKVSDSDLVQSEHADGLLCALDR